MTVSLPVRGDRDWLDWADEVTAAVNAGGVSGGTVTTGLASTVVEASRVSGDTQDRYQRRADGSVAVGPGGSTPLKNGEAFWVIDMGASEGRGGVRIYTSSAGLAHGFEVFDHLGAPIFAVPADGGPAVFGDNFRVFGQGEVFDARHQLHHDGNARINKGDAAGGVGVFALGEATTPPTRAPDGSASGTIAGVAGWVDSFGRLRIRRGSGPIDIIGGCVQDYFPPTAGVQGGDLWFNSFANTLNFNAGSVWQRVAVDILTKRPISANYTLVNADSYGMVLHSTASAAVTITLPSDTAANAISQEVAIPWRQYGAGQITFAAGTGATLQARGSAYKSAGQYAEGRITKVAANTWLVSGDISV